MKLKNGATDKVVGDGKKLYTGLTNVLVKAVNPTMDELIAMGYNPQQEPVYMSTNNNGKEKVRLDFYVENTETKFKSKITFWLENEVRMNKDGDKTQYRDKFGKTGWGATVNNLPDFVDKDSARPMFIGEDDFMSFIAAWINSAEGDEIVLDSIDTIVSKGNMKELQQMVRDAVSYGVRVLVGVTKDGKYQVIYTKHFGRPYQKTTTYFTKALNGQYSQFKADYTLDWQEYTPSLITADTETAKSPVAAGGEDDLPF